MTGSLLGIVQHMPVIKSTATSTASFLLLAGCFCGENKIDCVHFDKYMVTSGILVLLPGMPVSPFFDRTTAFEFVLTTQNIHN